MFLQGFFLGPLFPAAVIGSYSLIFPTFQDTKLFARPAACTAPDSFLTDTVATKVLPKRLHVRFAHPSYLSSLQALFQGIKLYAMVYDSVNANMLDNSAIGFAAAFVRVPALDYPTRTLFDSGITVKFDISYCSLLTALLYRGVGVQRSSHLRSVQ